MGVRNCDFIGTMLVFNRRSLRKDPSPEHIRYEQDNAFYDLGGLLFVELNILADSVSTHRHAYNLLLPLMGSCLHFIIFVCFYNSPLFCRSSSQRA